MKMIIEMSEDIDRIMAIETIRQLKFDWIKNIEVIK